MIGKELKIMKVTDNNISKYSMSKDRKINVLNIKEEYKNIENDMKENDINNILSDILFYIEEEEKREILKNYFKDYKYYKKSIVHILVHKDNKEIIILRNNNEKKFFINSHINYFLENRKENELLIDFENRQNEILINKNYIVYDYIKYDIIEK